MSEGLAAVQARVAQIQAMISPQRAAATGTTGSSVDFQAALAAATTDTGLPTGAPAGASMGEQAVTIAKKYLGIDYRWGGTDPQTGLDCSGLTQLVYKQLGVELPRTSGAQARTGTEVPSIEQARPGDLVFFGSPVHHVGVYVGNGKMLDAPHSGEKVQIRDVFETPSHIRRVLPDTPTFGVGAAGGTASAASLLGLGATGGLAGTPYAAMFQAAGSRYGVDPALLSAIAKAESSYRPGAVSPAGARGLMQIMPGTARSLGVDPDVPAQAIDGAARLMSENLRAFNGRTDLALAAYNAGPGAVRTYGGIPPYDETQTYVRRVTGYWGDLR
jgi:hypothetical protein